MPEAMRRELRELRDPPRSRKGVKAMLSRLRVGPTPKEIEDIVREVKVHHPKADVREMVRAFELAQVALRDGDFARYGTEIALVQAALQRLQVLAPGLAVPSPGTSASPSP